MASRRMPSRSAHSLTVSSSNSNRSIAVARNIEPATMRSTRRDSSPSSLRRSDAFEPMITSCNARNSSRPIVSWFSERGTFSSRREAVMWARSSSVPLLPTTIFGDSVATSSATGASARSSRSRSARRSRFDSGSLCTSSAVRRATPRFSLVAQARPDASPTMTSRLPPPRSKHSAGDGSSMTLARTAPKISRASVSPLITSTFTPASTSMRSTSSSPLAALRMALVAQAAISSTSAASASSFIRRTVAIACSACSGGMYPSRLTTSPRRSISFSRASGVNVPSWWISATRRWNEFVPRSSAAIRMPDRS